ncbi:MAG: hypothetical protein AAF525_04900 [Pseudomonadota bacterium]
MLFRATVYTKSPARILYIAFGILCLATPLSKAAQPLTPVNQNAEAEGYFGPADEVSARDADSIGAQHYRKGDYEQAFPYLQKAARNGFKMAQARISHIYLNGLGGIDRNVQAGIGWLGVAADRPTSPEIRKSLKDLRKQIPAERRARFDQVVDAYREEYHPSKLGVKCTNERSAGSHISRLKCDYTESRNLDDEIQLEEELQSSLQLSRERRLLTPQETLETPSTDRSENIF